ncbi:unnamed protein product [Ceutorhynchus assimilis]|uniref:DUF4780 domain-containing protein n=1 Tax=Ceutorhynchus assimilis TaxID=467358 RepID=A0A9N9QLR6_9CUCU|nr:unnamed protein product [Ceutorhynchus assimilis]
MNHGLDTREWITLHRESSGPGQTWTFAVDDISLEELRSMDFRPYFGFGQVRFRLKAKASQEDAGEKQGVSNPPVEKPEAAKPSSGKPTSSGEKPPNEQAKKTWKGKSIPGKNLKKGTGKGEKKGPKGLDKPSGEGPPQTGTVKWPRE